LCDDVRLHIAVIVLASPHETATWFECLRYHVINKSMLIPDFGSLKMLPVVSANKWPIPISVGILLQKLCIAWSTVTRLVNLMTLNISAYTASNDRLISE
jgi:hypothetical protein